MKKHPLEMTQAEREARHAEIAARQNAIEAQLSAAIADPAQPDVFPVLEREWAQLDTERRKIDELNG